MALDGPLDQVKTPDAPLAEQTFLGAYLPYLMNRVTREMLRGVDEKFSDRNLTVPTWRILAVLSDIGVCGFGKLADLASIEPATLSRFLGSLEEGGLIKRHRPKSDARTVEISLTRKGGATFRRTLPWAHTVEERLTRGLSASEVVLLKKLLTNVFLNLRDAETDPVVERRGRPRAPAQRVRKS